VSDALTALRTALAPKTGLRRIPLTLESYQHQSTQLSSKLLLNMFAEQQPADARSQVALIPTPGLSLLLNVGTGPIHAINDDLPGTIYVVSGTHFYRLVYDVGTAAWVASDLGDIGTPSGGYVDDQRLYSIAVGSTAAVVCVPPNSYVTSGGSPVALITTTWPATVRWPPMSTSPSAVMLVGDAATCSIPVMPRVPSTTPPVSGSDEAPM
jgi:hypothetical protein